MKTPTAPMPMREQVHLRGAAAEEPEEHQPDCRRDHDERDVRPETGETGRRKHCALTHCGDRLNTRRAQRGADRGDQRDDRPDDERDDDCPGRKHRRDLREVDPERDEQLVEQLGEAEPEEEPDHRGDHADHECFEHHRPVHLPARRAERAQGGELAHALRDGDAHRVRDHEDPDEERDVAEGEQEVLENGQEGVRVVCGLLRLLLAGLHLGGRRQDRLDLGDELLGRHIWLGRDTDRVESALLVEEPLGGRQVEDRDRRTAERVHLASELHEPGDPELLHRTAGDHADRVTHLEVLARRRLLVDRGLVGAARPATFREDERVEALLAFRVDAEREVRRPADRDHLVVVAHELRLVRDAALGDRDSRESAHLREQRLRHRRQHDAVVLVAADCALALNHGVGVLVDLREDGAERGLDRVGQDVGAADHRDAEHDRDRRQCGAQSFGRAGP